MKEFFRNFKKQRTVGLLNICSLSLGVMVSIVIGLWAMNELSFDRFHKNKDRIYRTVTNYTLNGEPVRLAGTYRPFGEQAKEELPVIEEMCRIYIQNQDISVDNLLHLDVRSFVTDPNFFTFFTFSVKEGDPVLLLNSPDKVVISETAASRYFPGQNPIGKIIKCKGNDFAVSGIMKDMPKNSSLQADFVFPFFGWYAETAWGNMDSYLTFFLLQEGVAADGLTEPLTKILHDNVGSLKKMGTTLTLESLADMHFSGPIFDWVIKGNKSLVMIFVLMALIILIVSCINFINLFVSTSFIRAKTIGIKKTVGAKRMRLIREFYRETACYVFIAISVGLALTHLIMPVFNNFTQSNLTLDFTSQQLYVFLAVLFVFVVLLAGSFPALYMMRFNPLETLKGTFKGKKVSFFQKSLTITQFAASLVLLIVVAFMQKQVNYMISYDLGFNVNHVIHVQGRKNFKQNFKALEGEFLAEPTIKSVTMRNQLPVDWSNGWAINKLPLDNTPPVSMDVCWVSPNHFDFFEIEIMDGENPFFYESTTRYDVIINESAVRILGLEQPVGAMISNGGDSRFTVRGVARNAYTRSLRQDVDPQIYIKYPEDAPSMNVVFFFKIEGDPQRAITFIERKWKEHEAEYPFVYHFLDDTYRQLYTAEKNAGKVFAFAMLITLMITVAGLFAMVYYATQRRMKEVAIRKVYGASLKDIFTLLNKSFMLWVAIAFAIACPVAYYGLHKWLYGFVVKTSLNVWVFLLTGLVAFLITLLTTGYQTWKVATTNPVESIKN